MKLLIILSLIFTIINFIFLVIILFLMPKTTKNNISAKTQENNIENSFIIDIPKKENSGEDAPPFFVSSENKEIYVVGVFDGMGGSGSTLYEEDGEIHTGAYLASRVVKKTTEQFLKKRINDDGFAVDQALVDSLKIEIIEKLEEKLDKQTYPQSNIRSSLVRPFPTTMAVGLISQQKKTLKIDLLWAGDSRVYLLSSRKGLIQLTKDDLKLDNDPFQNIENDSALSNMIYLGGNFSINFKKVEVEETEPALFFAATDGCFGYFPTPIHFENLLLGTLQNSVSIKEWQQNIIEILRSVSGDDFSISLVGLATKNVDFSKLKTEFSYRYKLLWHNYMEKITDIEKIVSELKGHSEEFAEYEQKRKNTYKECWNEYKKINYANQQLKLKD